MIMDGGDLIAWGGAAFAQSLSRLRLVDEYRLIMQPVALGDGLPRRYDGRTVTERHSLDMGVG